MIKEIEQIIERKFGYVAEKIEKVENVSNNTVYKKMLLFRNVEKSC